MVAPPVNRPESTGHIPLQAVPQLAAVLINRSRISNDDATFVEAEPIDVSAEWFSGTIDAMTRLPWDNPNWTSENPRPVNGQSVAELLMILVDVLPKHALVPDITPNWDGGAMATWIWGDLILEIETKPGRILLRRRAGTGGRGRRESRPRQ